MSEKRPFPGNGLDDGHDSKRPRSAQASPAPDNDVERKRREVAERIAAMKARLQGNAAPSSPSPAPTPASQSTTLSAEDAKKAQIQAQLAAIKAKIAQKQHQQPQTDIPTRPAAHSPGLAPSPPVRDDTTARARGGLNVGLHPSLLGGPSKSANNKKQKDDPAKHNPYLAGDDQKAAAQNEPFFDPSLQKQKDRKSKQLLFNQKGKFMAQAEALRQQARIEQMAKEMQEQARKQAIEEATEKSFLVPAPPEIEWWDEGLVTGGNYENLEAPNKINMDVITRYVPVSYTHLTLPTKRIV